MRAKASLIICVLAACASESATVDPDDPPPVQPGTPRAAQVGIYSSRTSFYELATAEGSLRFHFGDSMSKWNYDSLPFAGDFDGDGLDTIASLEVQTGIMRLADANDSDEFAPRSTFVTLEGVPPPPRGNQVLQLAIAGDWDGDGRDGVAIYHPATNTFYLRQSATSGAADLVVTLEPTAGFPSGGRPLAGDWDGDGDDELGLFAAGRVYLIASLEQTSAPASVFDAPGERAVAADFDADGIDTVATFAAATNTFTIRDANRDDANLTSVALGHAEPAYWTWEPVAGAWQVPTAPVASAGFAWTVGSPADHRFEPAKLAAALDAGAAVGNTLSVLVARDGVLVGERYYHGFDRDIAGNIKSVTKSVMSALIGIALDDGLIGSLDDRVSDYIPEYFVGMTGKQAIQLDDLMTMRSGLAWDQDVDLPDLIASNDYAAFALAKPLVAQPGRVFNYGPGQPLLGAHVLTKVSGQSALAFARQHLLEPLGISIPRWDTSPEGVTLGACELWMRPRDLARFGQLYLAGGTLDGAKILSPSWVAKSADPFVPELGGRLYGLWWRERPWANYPGTDSYFGWGFGGQFVFVFPSWNLVVVVTSSWDVSGAESTLASDAVFAFVDQKILAAVRP